MTRPGWFGVTSAVALAMAACGCSQAVHAASPTPAPTSTVTTTAASPTVPTSPAGKADPSGHVYSQAAAAVQAGRVAGRVHLPAGAVLQHTPVPAPLLHESQSIGALNGEVTRWWTVPGNAAAVEQWVLHDPPTGLQGGHVSGPLHGESVDDFTFPPGARQPETQVDVSFAQDGSHTDVRVHVQVVWTPARTPVEHIPATVASAIVTSRPERNSPTTHVPTRTTTLTGARLHRLAAVLNAQWADSETGHSCPMSPLDAATITVTFSYGGHRVVFEADGSSCQGVQVTADGKPQPALARPDLVMAAAKGIFPAKVATTGTTATLDYTPPAGRSRVHVHRTVAGATFQRLAADLAALTTLPSGNVTCNVVNGESATITVTTAGHTKVFVVDGSPCRGVRLTIDGRAQPLLAGSITLLHQVRAIAGTSGLAHPMLPGGVSSP